MLLLIDFFYLLNRAQVSTVTKVHYAGRLAVHQVEGSKSKVTSPNVMDLVVTCVNIHNYSSFWFRLKFFFMFLFS